MTVRRVPVGATPEKRYATWAEHRAAISLDAAAAREKREAARREVGESERPVRRLAA